MTAAEWESMVLVGRILRPHGNRGHVLVLPETDFIESRFAPGAIVMSQRAGIVTPMTITACRVHDGRPIVGINGVESINDAETLRGCELRVPADELPVLAPGQYWRHDLIGCVVQCEGRDVGRVIRVDDAGTTLLVVADSSGQEVLVPLIDSICRRVDIAARAIEIAPMAGLLDLNTKSGRAGEANRGR